MKQKPILEKLNKLGFHPPESSEQRTNPFSGVTCLLVPDAIVLYDFITNRHLTCGVEYSRTLWNQARYLFLEMWTKEYYALID